MSSCLPVSVFHLGRPGKIAHISHSEAIAAIDIDTDSDHDEERGISQV